jgi:hypothetical protein
LISCQSGDNCTSLGSSTPTFLQGIGMNKLHLALPLYPAIVLCYPFLFHVFQTF